MQYLWRGMAAIVLAASTLLGTQEHESSAKAPPVPALAYVVNGQVVVQENGNLTQVGPGQNPVWSPTGANLLYVVASMPLNTADIYVTDAHGANSHRVLLHAYPYVVPSWSPDGKYIVYVTPAPGANANAGHFMLQIRAMALAGGKVRVLGQIPFTGGCGLAVSAVQAAEAQAQGAYHGTPSTLIWAQPNRVVVQNSCNGLGLDSLTVGGAPRALTNWSGGVLSPDGKTIAAVVAGHGGSQVGLLTAATGKIEVLGPRIGAAVLAWSTDGKQIYGAVEPSDPKSGYAHLYHLSRDGKSSGSLGMIQAAGIFHLSLDPTGVSIVAAVVSNAAANASAPPKTLVYAISAKTTGTATAIIAAFEPSWRP